MMKSKSVLCYGDSNTWGFIPGRFNPKTLYMERYEIGIRWPSLMGKILGEKYYVIEEGLNGRTTNIEYPDLEGRSGASYIIPCLYSHSPLDIVILQLGVNDLKIIFNRGIRDIRDGIIEIVNLIQNSLYGPDMQSAPEILLVAPPPLEHEGYKDADNISIFSGAVEKSLEFNRYFCEIAEIKNCHYLNLADYVRYSHVDGLHLDHNGHKTTAKVLSEKIKKIFDDN